MEESSPVLVSGHFLRISAASDRRVRSVCSLSCRDCLLSLKPSFSLILMFGIGFIDCGNSRFEILVVQEVEELY